MRFVIEFLGGKRNRNKHKQPKQWVATDFLKEQLHKGDLHFPQTFAIVNKTKVQWTAWEESAMSERCSCSRSQISPTTESLTRLSTRRPSGIAMRCRTLGSRARDPRCSH
jgi:hypothetical protein